MQHLDRVDRYLALDRHEQVGAGAAAAEQNLLDMEPAEDVEAAADEAVTLDKDDPKDYGGAPVPSDEYVNIPLRANRDIISILIKKVGFIRQKNWNLEDHLFRQGQPRF